MNVLRILIDPGHGGRDSGAVSGDGKLLEKDVVLAVSNRLAELLSKFGVVELSRSNDHFVKLHERSAIANSQRLDLLSIHANAGGGRGFEVFTSPGQTRSDPWATSVLEALAEEFPERPIRSDLADGDADKEARFTVLTRTSRAAILVELGFIDTPEGAEFLADGGNQERLALAIARGTLAVKGIDPSLLATRKDSPKTLEERVKALEALHPELQ